MKPFNPKPRPCPICRNSFVPCKPMQSVCSPKCAVKQVRQAKAVAKVQAKVERAETKKRKEALLTPKQTMGKAKAKAQTATNAYVLVRDADRPCISCGRTNAAAWHAGHFRSRGSAPHLALDLRNIWKQCAACNVHLHGNLIEYRKQLVREKGEAWVQELENDQEPRQYKAHELEEIAKERRAKVKEMRK